MNQVRSGWLIAFAFVLMYLGQALFMLPLMPFFMFDNSLTGFLLMQGSGTFGGILATLLVWKFLNKENIVKIGLRGPVTDMIFGLLLGAFAISFMVIILLTSKQITLENPLTEPEFSAAILAYFIFFILVGVFEEVFFRGYVIQTLLSRNHQPAVIYIVSALLFSLVHGTNPNVTTLGLINILLVGLLFAYMFLATKSLWLPIGFHITWNFFQGNIFGFSVSGIETDSVYVVQTMNGNPLFTGGSFGLEGGLLTTAIIVGSFFLTKGYVSFRD